MTKELTLSAYQAASARTMNPGLAPHEALANYALGLAGEAGEVVELVKKQCFHSKAMTPERFAEELGDVCFYLAALASVMNLDLGDIAQQNVEKLKARYPYGFQLGGGNR